MERYFVIARAIIVAELLFIPTLSSPLSFSLSPLHSSSPPTPPPMSLYSSNTLNNLAPPAGFVAILSPPVVGLAAGSSSLTVDVSSVPVAVGTAVASRPTASAGSTGLGSRALGLDVEVRTVSRLVLSG